MCQIPPDPKPSKAELDEILRSQDAVYLDEYVARWFATILWRARLAKADPDAFWIPTAQEVRVIPDGHLTLDSYLQSDRWAEIRQRVMDRAQYRCECCGAWAVDIHIGDYRPRVLRGGDIRALLALCRRCLNCPGPGQDVHQDNRCAGGTPTICRKKNERSGSVSSSGPGP